MKEFFNFQRSVGMKVIQNIVWGLVLGFFSSVALAHPFSIFHKSTAMVEPEVPNSAINTLTKCDFTRRYINLTDGGGEVTQVIMHFSNPLYYEKSCDEKSSTITLYFPGMQQQDFNEKQFIEKCQQLAHIKQVTITTETRPVKRVVARLVFTPGQATVRMSKIENPHCLFIDCYPTTTLKKIGEVSDILRTAHAAIPQKVLPS